MAPVDLPTVKKAFLKACVECDREEAAKLELNKRVTCYSVPGTSGNYVAVGDAQCYFSKEKKLHRKDGPAVIWRDMKLWYRHGKLHRKCGPAVTTSSEKRWYRHGKLHRRGGPAEMKENGDEGWYWYGTAHRDDGPAATRGDEKTWYYYGVAHRRGGPAVTHADGWCWWCPCNEGRPELCR